MGVKNDFFPKEWYNNVIFLGKRAHQPGLVRIRHGSVEFGEIPALVYPMAALVVPSTAATN